LQEKRPRRRKYTKRDDGDKKCVKNNNEVFLFLFFSIFLSPSLWQIDRKKLGVENNGTPPINY
jgi:hypothetical protein